MRQRGWTAAGSPARLQRGRETSARVPAATGLRHDLLILRTGPQRAGLSLEEIPGACHAMAVWASGAEQVREPARWKGVLGSQNLGHATRELMLLLSLCSLAALPKNSE